ncbi:MAG: DUF4178 domain-containing protein [Desulfatibacillaceae bacterium]
MPPKFKCPSCGAPQKVNNPGVVSIVCEYCGNTVYWDKDKAKNAGKQATLPEGFSRLYRGASGTLFNKRFVVLGRARYSFGQGFWDEWFLEFDNAELGWLTEDNHEFAWQMKTPPDHVPPYGDMTTGAVVHVNDREYIITEVGEAECTGIEGELPKAVLPGEKYPYADGSTADGRHTLGIEYDDDPPTVFTGRWLKPVALELDDDGIEW